VDIAVKSRAVACEYGSKFLGGRRGQASSMWHMWQRACGFLAASRTELTSPPSKSRQHTKAASRLGGRSCDSAACARK